MQSLLTKLLLGNAGGGGGGNPSLNLNFVDGSTFDPRITFTRGTNATQFDSTGSLVYAPANLLVQSADFTTTWLTTSTTVTPNTTVAPDGTLTADTLTWGALSTAEVYQVVTPTATTGVFSVWARTASGTKKFRLKYYNGTVDAFSAEQVATTTWQRFSFEITGVAVSGNVSIRNSSPAEAGDLIVWGAQLNPTPILGGITSSLSTYYPTTASAYYGPRLDYNPTTLAAQGLLIEEQRTNSIRNNTMQGASAPSTLPTNWSSSYLTTLDGLTRGNSAAATVNGIASINVSLAGTATSTSNGRLVTMEPAGIGPIAALPGQTWTLSVYLTLVTGTMSGIQEFNIRLDFYDSAGTALTPALSSDVKSTITSTTSRPQFTATTPASTAFIRPSIQVSYANGAVIDFTLRIGLPQLELGAFATSVIPTTTTALTRNADVASVNTLSPWYNATEGTLLASFQRPVPILNSFAAELSDNTFNNFVGLYTDASNIFTNVRSGGAIQAAFNMVIGPGTAFTTYNQAVALKANDIASCINGGAVQADASCVVPTVTRLNIGAFNASAQFTNGWIRQIRYYPARLPDTALQQITT